MSLSIFTEAQSWFEFIEGFGNSVEVSKFRKMRCSVILLTVERTIESLAVLWDVAGMLRARGQNMQWTSGGWLFLTCKPMQRAITEIALLH